MRCAALLSVLLLGSAAVAQDGHTSRELERLPPQAADAAIRRDLLSILEPAPPLNRGMYRRLHAIGFTTRTYATAYRGVCGRDLLFLRYAAPAGRPNDPDAPLTPYSITATSSFHIDRLAAADRPREEAGRPEAAMACTRAAARDEGWIDAPSADIAVDALHALAAAQRAVATRQVTLACEGPSCSAAALALVRPDAVTSVERCDHATDQSCYRLQTDAMGDELTITTELSQRMAEPGAADPVRVLSVHWLTDQIIVT